MSLNGLDDPAIIESYQTALTEAGGWFLLKYVSRDVVALLARGTGGVAEIRITIDSYEEKSPLYGFLQYRRRKIILRYVPEGISRILQGITQDRNAALAFLNLDSRFWRLTLTIRPLARISVQFQSILDKFSPHDTVFALAVSSDLTENALSSACLLHAASRSMTSSSSSLRRCKLGGITEDAEVEESASIAGISIAASSVSVNDRRASVYSRTSEATAVPDGYRPGEPKPLTPDAAPIRSRAFSNRSDKPLPSIPQEYTNSHTNGVAQYHLLDQLSQPRDSIQSSRPSTRDLDQPSLRPPKIKLGPRPVDVNGRPRTAGSMGRSRQTRPVAALPAGVRLTTRKNHAPRPKSQPVILPPSIPSDAPPVPALLPPPPSITSLSRNPPASPRSIKSYASSIGVSPEKQRLMKALEMRKRQMEKQAQEVERHKREQKEENEAKEEEEIKITVAEVEKDSSRESSADPDVESGTREAVDESLPTSQSVELEPAQIPNEPPEDIKNEVKAPLADPSKLDSAVDLSITEQSSQKDISLPCVIPDRVEEAPSPTPSSMVDAPETDVAGPSEIAQDDNSPVNLERVDKEHVPKENKSPQTSSATPSNSDQQTEVHPCEIEIPSDLQCPDTPTPRAIPAEFPQTVGFVPDRALVQHEEVAISNETASLSDTEVSESQAAVEIPTANDIDKSDQTLEEPSDGETNRKDRKQKRRAMLEPIFIPQRNDELDEDHLLSDDSFMEELKSATLEEAKPVAVPKTPLTPFSSNGDISSSERWKGSRVVSNPSAGGIDVQALPIGRSASGPYFNSQNAVPVLVAKKVNVSSGISKRIKALEMFSSRESGASHAPVLPSPATVSSPFDKFRKRASMTPTNMLTPAATPKGNKSPLAPEGSNPLPSRHESLSPTSSMKGKPNSVCVTARIVRDPSIPPPDPSADPSEPSVLNLQRSQLIVEHDGDTEPKQPIPPTSPPAKQEKKRWSISSISSKHVQDPIPLRRSDSITSKLSVSSRSKPDGTLPSSSIDAHLHLDSVDEVLEEKKESRKSRLMRRVSTITSSSRRGLINALSPTLKEEDPPTPPPKEEREPTPEPPQVVDIGEVNVQFPDTLLWKRRFMRIDDHGYLILTPGTIDGTARNTVKRYHLSEFRPPTLPDQDRQELPNSIVLDFSNGSTLQCACESRNGQRAILQTLLDAHNTYRHR
ncbi:predicted protein [Uncinocarpus reesii 1704]|uniref:GPI-anchored cell surface glycoprotein n=1 Tax=Uncinocarpus reesii (strain UAMH 1704) TaxID=336963 RepID=C4JRE7_UNCRE|nr:uncharacterized protein UREG_05036 [Uncinocarpus reesii 1704]EEP80194.1 predicted protein [Uncinocarpus reesii 1704]